MNEQDTEALTNLTNAHMALSDTVNKHIEFTTTLENVVKRQDNYNCAMQSKYNAIISIQKERVDRLHSYMIGILLLNIGMTMLILWRIV